MRIVLITIAVIGLCVAWNCASDPPLPSETDTLKRIAEGVWFRVGEREHGHCNNVVIDVGEGLLVVDANFPSGAQALMEDIKQVTTKPVRYVFDTHHHGDHAYANAVWTRAGATTLAYIGVAEEMKRYEPTRWQQAAQTREDVAAVGEDSVQPPQQTFSDVPHLLEGASRRVEFHHFGWAHTRGDGMVYLPDEKILCTGDAIVNGPYNYTGDGNTGNWPDVVGKARELGFETILPGHGPSGGREVAEGQLQFFQEINAAVEKAFEDKTPLEELVTVENGAGVATTVELSGDVSNWVADRLAEQVRVRYTELAEGKPHGEILGGP
jgi:glyoxylase-like metal-dependent hydrolase (beta-lactamase superfamily II)